MQFCVATVGPILQWMPTYSAQPMGTPSSWLPEEDGLLEEQWRVEIEGGKQNGEYTVINQEKIYTGNLPCKLNAPCLES